MVIYYICDWDLSIPQAPTIHIMEIAENLQKLGHDVTVFAPNYGKYPDKTNVRIKYVNSKKGFFEHTIYNFFIFLALLFEIIKKRPNIIYIREYLLCFAPVIVGKIFLIPIILEINGFRSDQASTAKYEIGLFNSLKERFGKITVKMSDKVIAVTNGIKNVLIEIYKTNHNKIELINNGVNTKIYFPINKQDAKAKLGLTNSYLYVGYIGGFYPWQGIDYIINSASLIIHEIPNIRFILVGKGPEKQRYLKLIENKNLSKFFIYAGEVTIENSNLWINSFDVGLILKKPLKFGYSPLKLYTYMACKIPIIATRTEGFEIIEQIKNCTWEIRSKQTEDVIFSKLSEKVEASTN